MSITGGTMIVSDLASTNTMAMSQLTTWCGGAQPRPIDGY